MVQNEEWQPHNQLRLFVLSFLKKSRNSRRRGAELGKKKKKMRPKGARTPGLVFGGDAGSVPAVNIKE